MLVQWTPGGCNEGWRTRRRPRACPGGWQPTLPPSTRWRGSPYCPLAPRRTFEQCAWKGFLLSESLLKAQLACLLQLQKTLICLLHSLPPLASYPFQLQMQASHPHFQLNTSFAGAPYNNFPLSDLRIYAEVVNLYYIIDKCFRNIKQEVV